MQIETGSRDSRGLGARIPRHALVAVLEEHPERSRKDLLPLFLGRACAFSAKLPFGFIDRNVINPGYPLLQESETIQQNLGADSRALLD
jgi:hypothetical protein